MKKILTLCLVEEDGKILLGMKKRGFGEGRWNGFGGKVEEGESIEEAAARELQEESGITCEELQKRGIMTFTFDDNPKILEVHIFKVLSYFGEPIETEEMAPKWFLHEEIPYNQMWTDDKYWVPGFLQGKQLMGNFHFKHFADEGDANIMHWNLTEVDKKRLDC